MNLPPQLETKFQDARKPLPGEAFGADPHAAVRAGPIRLCQRRNDRGNRRAGSDLNTLQVTETMAYYSMLRRQPAGKYHVQVCTNVSCMLRGGNELYRVCAEKARKSATRKPPRTACFRWKKWNVSARAPALRPCRSITISTKISRSGTHHADFRGARSRTKARNRSTPFPARVHERHPAEVPVISRALRRQGFAQDRRLLCSTTAIKALGQGAEGIDAGTDHRRSEEIESARARRRGISDRHEVELRAQGIGQAEIRYLQRGRKRTRHLQRPPADGNGSAPVDRRHGDRRARGRIRTRATSTFAASIATCSTSWTAPSPKPTRAGYLGKNILGTRLRFRPVHAHRRGRLRMRRRIRADGIARRQARHTRASSRPSRRWSGSTARPTVINNVETLLRRARRSFAMAAKRLRRSGTPKNGGTRLFCLSGHVNKPGIYELPLGFNLKQHDRRSGRRHAQRQEAESRDSRRQSRARC